MIAELLYREALCLDEQRWDDWLALFTDDAVLWMPAWNGTHEQTDSPDTQLSLMYCDGRTRLEDRVWRIRSALSVASNPLPRTVHAVSNVFVTDERDGIIAVSASWTVHLYDTVRARQDVFFGRYRYDLRIADDTLRIARKTIVLANDRIPTMLDFYCV
jgi:3-phenylpropionate/cinnamic acid dioxygenase small subunit